jgi:hypothetical protein
MDEYPAGSLDHSVPFLLALGTRTGATYDAGLSGTLKEQAVLIRSDLPPLDSDQAHALLRYIRDRDASQMPCNARDASARKYRFRVKTAERVRAELTLPPERHTPKPTPFLTRRSLSSHCSCLRAGPVFPRALNFPRRLLLPCSTRPTPR